MNLLFLMAGRGSRFKEVGYKLPKPLIPVRGKPMVKWATDSLSFIKNANFIFICLRQQEEGFGITEKLKELYGPKIQVILANAVTEGAAMSALLAREFINIEEELIISNTDQYFGSSALKKELLKKKKEYHGMIPVFEATHPRWSFAKVNEKGWVTEVAEKVPISNHATVGVYYFRKGKDFVWAAQEMIRKDIRRNNEFFICPTFNELLGRGDKIKAVDVDFMWGLGTPEDVEYFEKYFKDHRY